ncbi:hypothetical protein DXG01_016135 [Tephrocybe rancida]|nr:hypothetical protein DXG01_016135 [Tephrocybe rancida]
MNPRYPPRAGPPPAVRTAESNSRLGEPLHDAATRVVATDMFFLDDEATAHRRQDTGWHGLPTLEEPGRVVRNYPLPTPRQDKREYAPRKREISCFMNRGPILALTKPLLRGQELLALLLERSHRRRSAFEDVANVGKDCPGMTVPHGQSCVAREPLLDMSAERDRFDSNHTYIIIIDGASAHGPIASYPGDCNLRQGQGNTDRFPEVAPHVCHKISEACDVLQDGHNAEIKIPDSLQNEKSFESREQDVAPACRELVNRIRLKKKLNFELRKWNINHMKDRNKRRKKRATPTLVTRDPVAVNDRSVTPAKNTSEATENESAMFSRSVETETKSLDHMLWRGENLAPSSLGSPHHVGFKDRSNKSSLWDPSLSSVDLNNQYLHCLKKRKRLKRSSRKSKRRIHKYNKLLFQSTPPATYDGAPDVQAYTRFLSHCTSYVKYSRVEKDRQVFVISQFLTGRAWFFYSCTVQSPLEGWSLEKFFNELYISCFPADIRNRQQKNLENYHQGTRTVRDYVAKLEYLFATAGATTQKERVIKLFQGLHATIQKQLRRAGLRPETSKWNAIVAHAKFIEMAQRIGIETWDAELSYWHAHRRHVQKRDGHCQASSNSFSHQRYRSQTPSKKKTNRVPGFSSVRGNPEAFSKYKPSRGTSKAARLRNRQRPASLKGFESIVSGTAQFPRPQLVLQAVI